MSCSSVFKCSGLVGVSMRFWIRGNFCDTISSAVWVLFGSLSDKGGVRNTDEDESCTGVVKNLFLSSSILSSLSCYQTLASVHAVVFYNVQISLKNLSDMFWRSRAIDFHVIALVREILSHVFRLCNPVVITNYFTPTCIDWLSVSALWRLCLLLHHVERSQSNFLNRVYPKFCWLIILSTYNIVICGSDKRFAKCDTMVWSLEFSQCGVSKTFLQCKYYNNCFHFLGLPVAILASSAFCLARFSRTPINLASALAILIASNTLWKAQ